MLLPDLSPPLHAGLAHAAQGPRSGESAGGDGGAETLEETRTRTRRPRQYRVILHNDDFTTMEFVVEVLLRHFSKTPEEATRIMLQVHREGHGLAGIYPRDVAETKVVVVTAEAQARDMPLLVTAEPE